MNDKPRAQRWPWLLGMLLLAASAIGAGVVLNQNSGGAPDKEEKPAPPPAIVCIGFVDVETGVANLVPLQIARVKWVTSEGHVSANAKLLELDDALAQSKLAEAEAAVAAAKVVMEQAKKLPEQHKLQLKQQDAAIQALEHTKSATQFELEIKERLYKDKLIGLADKEAVAALVRKLDAVIVAERAKFAELELKDPNVDMVRAEADYKAKVALRAQAKIAVDECTLLAPCDGTVLRVNVAKDELPNPKVPPIQFCPDGPRIVRGELIQEWASKVKPGQEVLIEDDAFGGATWKGEVLGLSEWYAQKRRILVEPFMMNDVRTLECLVRIISPTNNLRIEQRVRLKIKTGP